MKYQFAIIALLLVTSAPVALAEDTDRELTQKLVGIWSANDVGPNYTIYGETFYRADGTSKVISEACINSKCTKFIVEGVWSIRDRILSDRTTSTNTTIFKVGEVTEDVIKDISETTLTLYYEKAGETLYRYKVTEPRFFNSKSLTN